LDKYRIIVRNAHDKSTNELISKLSAEQTAYTKYSRTLASQRTCLREKAEKAAGKTADMLKKHADEFEDSMSHILSRNTKSARCDDGTHPQPQPQLQHQPQPQPPVVHEAIIEGGSGPQDPRIRHTAPRMCTVNETVIGPQQGELFP